LFVSSRRHQLNAIEATRRALRRGVKVQTPSALLETITGQVIEALDHYAEGLAAQLDRAEERILADELNVDRQVVGSVRRMTVRLHRQLVTLRSLIHRFEHDIEDEDANPAISLPTEKLAQRLDWLDTAIVELRDRSRLLQEEIMVRGSEPARARDRDHRLSACEPRRRTVRGQCRWLAVGRRTVRLSLGDRDHRRRLGGRLLAVEALRHGWTMIGARRAGAGLRRARAPGN
jgi:CorA-like Mg2+ transporter protein